MKRYKRFYPVNNQEDEDSSCYPLYPAAEDINEKEKSKTDRAGNTRLKSIASGQRPYKEPAQMPARKK
jgi:hypothetical protein